MHFAVHLCHVGFGAGQGGVIRLGVEWLFGMGAGIPEFPEIVET